ncbi:MAG: tetratricopeptide repeat protein [Myxococcota bacterium]|nr:tetratricopeptide repeat protein [Myxococcota bacterium]
MRLPLRFPPVRAASLVAKFLFLPVLVACVHPAPLPAKAIALNRDGAAAMAAGDLEKAEARVALALEYNPRFTEAWVNLGIIEMDRGNFQRALRDFVKARDLNPDLPAPHHALGLLADREGHITEAEKYYRAALKVDPGFAPARINLARRLFEEGLLEEAREQFLRVTQVAPEFVDGWTGLCETLLRLRRSDEAEEVLAHAHEHFGAHPNVALLDARFLLRRSAFADAAERLAPLCALPDRHQASAALSWLAIARLGEGDVQAASEAAERARSLDPDDAVARYALQMVRANAAR